MLKIPVSYVRAPLPRGDVAVHVVRFDDEGAKQLQQIIAAAIDERYPPPPPPPRDPHARYVVPTLAAPVNPRAPFWFDFLVRCSLMLEAGGRVYERRVLGSAWPELAIDPLPVDPERVSLVGLAAPKVETEAHDPRRAAFLRGDWA